uniref:transporter substrate-binding domain-containing protein n=1 Tax=Pseudomonas bijieensis TaxID=2681983 RepID=UPI00398ADF4E
MRCSTANGPRPATRTNGWWWGRSNRGEIYSCMLRKDDPQFLALVNATLADLYKSGEINEIYARWFQKPIPPKGLNLEFPMTSELKAIIAKPTSEPVQ